MSNSENAVTSSAGTSASAFQVTRSYGVYILVLFWLVGLLRFMDIQIFAVVLESVGREFNFSDTQLGILGGLAFALFYATLGIPIAWMVDRYNRVNILCTVLAIWSGMTAVCGTAIGFFTLFLARMGVGIGEAGALPSTYSLLSDYFPPKKRATIMAIFNTSVPVGVCVGLIFGGWIVSTFDWRTTFYLYGIPGVMLAIILKFTLREPPRGFSENRSTPVESANLMDTVKFLLRLRSYRHLVMAMTIMTLGAYGSGVWIPTFFTRIHEMGIREVTVWLGWIYGGGGIVGAMLGGWLTDRLSTKNNDARWYLKLPAIAALMIMPFSFFVYLWSDPYTALTVHIGTTILMHMYMGPGYGTVLTLGGAKRRAMAAGVNLLVINFLGIGFGPVIVGSVSDYLNSVYGVQSIRYSMLGLVVIAYTWASLHFFMAARTLREDIETSNQDAGE